MGNIQKQKGVSNFFLSVVHTVPTYGSSRGPRARLCNNFYDAAGSHQLQVLYLCYLVLRVCLRKFKGSALKDDMWFIFEWEKVELPADLAKELLIVLNYHNVTHHDCREPRQTLDEQAVDLNVQRSFHDCAMKPKRTTLSCADRAGPLKRIDAVTSNAGFDSVRMTA